MVSSPYSPISISSSRSSSSRTASRSRRLSRSPPLATTFILLAAVLFVLWRPWRSDGTVGDGDSTSIITTLELLQSLSSSSNTSTTTTSGTSSILKNDDDVDNTKSVNSYWWPSFQDGGVLGALHDRQHPTSCQHQQQRFLVFRSTGREDRGLTAWAKTFSAHMAHALSEGRIVISDQTPWPMAKNDECAANHVQTQECFFESLSSCTLQHVDPPSDTTHAFIMETSSDVYDSETIRTVYSPKTWFKPIADVEIFKGLGLGSEHNRLWFEAAALAYYVRPRPWLRDEIHQRLRRSIPADLNPDRTIGVVLRRSDKCAGHDLTGHPPGEMQCVPLNDFVEACKTFVAFDGRIENIIVTSEDREALDTVISQLKQELPRLRMVTNVGDVQQGTGSSVHRVSNVNNVTNREIVASALTSMHMHLRARYLVITTQSSWTSSVAVLSRVYGFSSRDVLALDLSSRKSIFPCLARKGSAC